MQGCWVLRELTQGPVVRSQLLWSRTRSFLLSFGRVCDDCCGYFTLDLSRLHDVALHVPRAVTKTTWCNSFAADYRLLISFRLYNLCIGVSIRILR